MLEPQLVTFASLKERWRNQNVPCEAFPWNQRMKCSNELESLERQVKELLYEYQTMADRQEDTKAGRVVHGMCVTFIGKLNALLGEQAAGEPQTRSGG